MTPLGHKIAEHIRIEGPIGVDRYWNFALFDREHGYYSAAEPFGRSGDFVTAPEISQMFGELIGAWLASAWRELGSPSRFVLAEIGPGRGTLMADMLRTIRTVAPECLKAADVTLVETSDRLAAEQMGVLERFDMPIRRIKRVEDVKAAPLIVVANELFDAVPTRQFVFDGREWRERCVSVAQNGRFEFVLCGANPDIDVAVTDRELPAPMAGAVLEISPARERLADGLARHLANHGGAGLFVDYGHAATGYGDTLQAVHGHAYADPLDRPGDNDITSHVDFDALVRRFEAADLAVAPIMTQGDFLQALGLVERAGALGHDATQSEREAIVADVERLAGKGKTQMGALFKVLCAASGPLSLAPFLPSGSR